MGNEKEARVLGGAERVGDEPHMDSWDITSQGDYAGVVEEVCTGVSYTPGGDAILYAFYRKRTRNAAGAVVAIGPEIRRVIDVPEAG